MGISSLALPPLGCGLGGLSWPDVKSLIEKYLGSIADLDVYVYESIESKMLPNDFREDLKSVSSNDEGLAAQQAFL